MLALRVFKSSYGTGMKFLKIGLLTVMLYSMLSLNFQQYLWVQFSLAVLYNTLSSKQDLSGSLLLTVCVT